MRRVKKQKPVHLRLPPKPKVAGIYIDSSEQPVLGSNRIVFRRSDEAEFRIEFVGDKFLEIHFVASNFEQRLTVQSQVSNGIQVGVGPSIDME